MIPFSNPIFFKAFFSNMSVYDYNQFAMNDIVLFYSSQQALQ